MPLRFLFLSLLLPALAASPVLAAGDALPAAVRAQLDAIAPGKAPDGVKAMSFGGLYEIRYGADVLYVTADGRYAVQGVVVDLTSGLNLTEEARSAGRREFMATLKDDDMVVYAPAVTKHTITVFTDIDCGYCRKLHQEMKEFNRLGIKVRYLPFPRAGIGSPSHQKLVSVWCADDRKAAMDLGKAGKEIEYRECQNSVADQFVDGQDMGVNATPTIFLEGGETILGYRPAADIAAILDQLAETRRSQGR